MTAEQEAVLIELADRELAARRETADAVVAAEGRYSVLGIHVPRDEAGNILQGQPLVVRVRMIVKGQEVDEDFAMPALPKSVQATELVILDVLKSTVDARVAEVAVGLPDVVVKP